MDTIIPLSNLDAMPENIDAADSLIEADRHSHRDTGVVQASIVVPTCGRPELLNRCLASLVAQHVDPSIFEIIIVDDRPSAATRDAVAGWAARSAEKNGPVVTYVASHGPHGPAAARNRGWRAARGTIVAFTDDDTIATPNWLQTGLRVFDNDPATQAVWGRIVMPLNKEPTDYELDATHLERAEFVTANCFCRKEVLAELGGFDERFRFAWREDADLYFNLLDYNAVIVHEPAAVITHPVRPAGWGVSLSQQKKVLFDALLYKKHPQRYREKIRATPRWDYYLIVASLFIFLTSLVSGEWSDFSLLATGIWFVMTARFCLLRLKPTIKTPSHIAEMIVTSALIPPLATFWRLVGAVKFRVPFI